MQLAEHHLRLIHAEYRSESVRQRGVQLAHLRARCEMMLDRTVALVENDDRLKKLLADTRREIRQIGVV